MIGHGWPIEMSYGSIVSVGPGRLAVPAQVWLCGMLPSLVISLSFSYGYKVNPWFQYGQCIDDGMGQCISQEVIISFGVSNAGGVFRYHAAELTKGLTPW